MDTSMWPLALEALQALGAHYRPAMEQAAAESGLSDWYGWLLAALAFEPQPVSAERLRGRTPYTAAQTFEDRLASAAQKGWLKAVAPGEYRLTEVGQRAARRIMEAAYAAMSPLKPLPPADLERLAALLQRIVEASVKAPEPPGHWGITLSRRTDPGKDAPVMVRIDQYLSDLGAYRDDSHIGAWQPYGVSAHAWESLTFIWRGEAASLDDLYQKLGRRGYSRQANAEALQELVARGWAEEEAGAYRLTERGRALREEAEERTDRYFYAPWACLSGGEREELHGLLMRLRDSLRQSAA